ncbi:MAG: hypothetical protein RBG13Loki_0531 [Promethearchaeota archaeon CR_4]|nr:MAG: hypothetical protein RBG13Loki_0531 [Candidatus Lokiarchaeota archaeon CR_4]
MPAKTTHTKYSVGTTSQHNLIEVRLNKEKAQEIAYMLAQEGKTWDECTWMFAEYELKLAVACSNPKHEYKWGGLPKSVKIYPSRILQSPREEDVRQLAYEISQRGSSIQDLHWFIAQRRYVSDFVTHGGK